MHRSGGMRGILAVLSALLMLTAGLIPSVALAVPAAFPHPEQPRANAQDDTNNSTPQDPMLKIGTLVRIVTNWGTMVLGMYDDGAPITVSNFLNLTRSSFYNDLKFHRIIDGFVIQTGDPNSKDNNPYNDGYGGSGESIPLEVSSNLTHIDGAVGMARSSDPNSGSSQFYVCDGPQHSLDGNYAVFAVVVEGMDTVKKISAAPTYGYKRPALKDHPIDDIIMTSVSIQYNWTEPEKPKENMPYFLTEGGDPTVGLLFWLGLGVVFLVLVVLIVRRVVRRRRARIVARGADEVYEAEVVDDGYGAVDGPGPGGPAGEEGWQGRGSEEGYRTD